MGKPFHVGHPFLIKQRWSPTNAELNAPEDVFIHQTMSALKQTATAGAGAVAATADCRDPAGPGR